MPSTAVLELPLIRAQHHRPRRDATATSVLRAIDATPPSAGEDVASSARALPHAGSTAAGQDAAPAVRSLRMRDIAAGGAAATGSWTLASHLGLLGTASGTFIVSVVSTVLVALASDSLTGTRRVIAQHVGRWQRRRRHIHRD